MSNFEEGGGAPGGPEIRQPGPLGKCIAGIIGCTICLICTPLIALCCCCNIANSAINQVQGKRYDTKLNAWVIDDLEKDKLTIPNQDDADLLSQYTSTADDQPSASVSSSKTVKETEYYEALGITADATESNVKRAYYLNARKWHPDKNDSEEAKKKFQEIGEAYQVLSDSKLRKTYDVQGKDGLSADRTELSTDTVDPSLIFIMLFGSDSFNDIVGRLHVVTETIVGQSSQSAYSSLNFETRKTMSELERRRTVRLAINLVQRIQPYILATSESEKVEILRNWESLSLKLVDVRYGEEILNTVGKTYNLVAQQVVGNWLDSIEAKKSEQDMKFNSLQKLMNPEANVEAAEKKERDEDPENRELLNMIELMWNATVIDICTTIREVVMKVLHDKSADDETRASRADAIMKLGKIYETTKSTSLDLEGRSKKTLFQSATAAAMEETLRKMRDNENKAKDDLDS